MNTFDRQDSVIAAYLEDENQVVIRLPKQLDYAQILALQEAMERNITRPCAVYVDAASLQSLDSAAIGMLVYGKQVLDSHGGQFYLCNLAPGLLECNRDTLKHHFVMESNWRQ